MNHIQENYLLKLSGGRAFRFVMPGIVILLIFYFGQAAFAQAPVTVTVQPGESVRDLAQKYFDDPDLWEEILRSNQLKSPAEIKAGMQLKISPEMVQLSGKQLSGALQAIQKATEAGARVFAGDSISQSISIYNEALASRKSGEWKKSIELAQFASIKAESALHETMSKRNTTGVAELSDRKGTVESRKAVDPIWANAPLLAKFIEGEMVRTLSSSFAEISFQDESRLRLNENSQAVIQRMREDLLERKRESSVSLVTGNAFALLQSNQKKKTFDFVIPGVSAKVNSKSFWIQKDEKAAKFANYEGELEVTAQGATVVLGENQGALVEANKRPKLREALLASPGILSPEKNQKIFSEQVTLRWTAVDSARVYWLEIASDESFRKLLVNLNSLGTNSFTSVLAEGKYHWHVAAIDASGFPSRFSDAGFFTISFDKDAPFLQLSAPEDQALLRENEVMVIGKTEKDVVLILNGNKVAVTAGGFFQVAHPLKDGLNEITLEAKDLAGNVSSIVRRVTYVADARVVISYDPGLKQIQPKHFIVSTAEFTLNGRSTPLASIFLKGLSTSLVMKTFADKQGAFQIVIPNVPGKERFVLSAQTPAGYATQDTIVVEVDDTPPRIILDGELPTVSSSPTMRVRGSASGATTLQVNGREVNITNEKFETTVDLQSGLNTVGLIAKDFAGNVVVLEKSVRLDTEPPKLLDHKLTSQIIAGERVIHVLVKAQDEASMTRTAKFTLQAGSFVHTGYLQFNPALQAYEERVKIPAEAPAQVILKSVVLEDYHGNQKEYRVN